MSAPRAKRQFAGAASDPAQRQITSFFTAAAGTGASDAAPSPTASTLRPILPAETQSNLLNVGMRVRKSVPEGYKTGNIPSKAFDVVSFNVQPPSDSAPVSRVPSLYYSSQRELLPFCGINKIGGLSPSQPSFSFDAPHDTSALQPHIFRPGSLPDIDNVPALSSSQDSIASNGSILFITTSFPQNRKRIHEDGDESDTPSLSECLQVPKGEWMDGQVSPRSLVPMGWENTRVMAVPKGKRKGNLQKSGCAASSVTVAGVVDKGRGPLDQENMMVDDDFSEAEFLDYRALSTEDSMEI